jgi:MtrB/PioB family decaheme-associated outer membrane protein
MRATVRISIACWLYLALAGIAQAQTATPPPPPKDPAQPPAAAPAQPPAPAPVEDTRSLFEPTWRQASFGGRFSSVEGDPARFQRYQDIRDGVIFTDGRYAQEHPEGDWLFRVAADNVGYRDQRYVGTYERTGRFVISGMWDEIPQFYSVDTQTPFSGTAGTLVLDDATQRAIQNGQATLSAYVPSAGQFDLRERRDIGNVHVRMTPTTQLDVTANFTTQAHVGELPFGASFGFSNDVEVALPYNSRANDFTLGTEWTNGRQMLRASYTGSWFNNHDETLVWDSPLRLDDDPDNGPGRGRMSLWPSNSAQTVSLAGYTKLARRTQLTGFVSFGNWQNDEVLQPFTINATLPQLALPRSTTEASANIFSTNLSLVSRPANAWRFSARLRRYDYRNDTPPADIPQYISLDEGVSDSLTGGPRLFAHDRTNFDLDATWTRLLPLALTAGYSYNGGGYDARTFDSTGENSLFLSADAVGTQWVTVRARYDYADRSGSGLDEASLIDIGEQPLMRHYDLANRTRNRFSGQVDVIPNDTWIFSGSAALGKDDFADSYFGLQESRFRTFSVGADFRQPNGFGGGVSYNYERYSGIQRSRSANPGQENDPNRDWTIDTVERVDYFSIYATPPRIGSKTEARLSYDYSLAKGSSFYAIVPGGPLTPPSQLPQVHNKLQQLNVDVRHRLTSRFVAKVTYLYEPFRVFDYAFDQSVVNGIVQPSSLVLGYIYRPYTAHSAVVAVMYFW